MAQAFETVGRTKRNGSARGALKARTHDVLEDFTELRKDMARLAEAANKAARSEVNMAKTTANKRLGELSANLRSRASGGAEYVTEQVRTHPAAAIGISVGAGVLLGALLLRR